VARFESCRGRPLRTTRFVNAGFSASDVGKRDVADSIVLKCARGCIGR
jgi:hypothetical protein